MRLPCPRCARGALVGQRGLPRERGLGGAAEREPDRSAAVLAGVEPGGEPLALPALPLLVARGVPGLRRPAGGGDGDLAKGLSGPGEGPIDLCGPLSGGAQIILLIRIRGNIPRDVGNATACPTSRSAGSY